MWTAGTRASKDWIVLGLKSTREQQWSGQVGRWWRWFCRLSAGRTTMPPVCTETGRSGTTVRLCKVRPMIRTVETPTGIGERGSTNTVGTTLASVGSTTEIAARIRFKIGCCYIVIIVTGIISLIIYMYPLRRFRTPNIILGMHFYFF